MKKTRLSAHLITSLLFMLICMIATQSLGATLRPETSDGCTHLLSGEIEAGDADKLMRIMGSIPRICLDSPGGSYKEALEIIRRAKGKQFKTIVPSGARCLSACALIFLAGNWSLENKPLPWRKLHIRGKLGFHGPYVELPNTSFSREDTEEAYRAGVTAIAQLLQTGTKSLFPQSLLAQALTVGPREFLYVDTVGKAGGWKILLEGYRAPERLYRRHAYQACMNAEAWDPPHAETPEIGAPSARLSGRDRRLRFSDANSRNVFDKFGNEASEYCVAVFIDAGRGFYGLNLDIVSEAKSFTGRGQPVEFQHVGAWSRGSLPLYAIFPMETTLASLRVETRQRPEYEPPLTCTDGKRTWRCKPPPKTGVSRSTSAGDAAARRYARETSSQDRNAVGLNGTKRVALPGRRNDLVIGWARGYRRVSDARMVAQRACRGRCRVAGDFANSCAALAVGDRGRWGFAKHQARTISEIWALRACGKRDRNCKVRQWLCSNRGGAIAVR